MFAFLLGSSSMILAVLYLGLSIFFMVWKQQLIEQYGVIFYIFQAFVLPILLFISGTIFLVKGRELALLLNYALFLNHLLIFYFLFKDIYLLFIKSTTKR